MNAQTLIDVICDLVRIPSCSDVGGGDEGRVQAYVEQQMRATGARVRTFEAADVPGFLEHPICCGPDRCYAGRPTVIGELGPEDAPALLVLAHSDVVSINNEPELWTADPFEPVVRDGRVYGRGAGDDKWGVASLLTLMRDLVESNTPLRKRLIFASTIDEENGVGNGLLLLALAGIKAEAALYLDGCDMYVMTGNLGGSNIYLHPVKSLTAAQIAEHAATIERGCRRMSEARSDLFDQLGLEHNDARTSSISFRFDEQAEDPVILVPFYTLPGEDGQALGRDIEAMIAEVSGDDLNYYKLSYRAPWFEPTQISEDHPWVQSFCNSFRKIAQCEPEIKIGTKQDSFVLRKYANIPTLSFGVSRFSGPGAIHTHDEYIEIDRAWQGWRIARQALLDWCEASSS